jgi:exosome complex component RRP42
MKDYIKQVISTGKHIDGRDLEEFRDPISIETGISSKAEGSARVKIGKTEVIAGVKMEIGTPYPDSPDEGTIIISAELLPMSNPNFESGPPGIQAIEMARVIDRGIRESGYIDFKKLCIKKGEQIWMVLIDIFSLNDEGNLLDAAALAVMAALKDAKFPVVKDDRVDYGNLSTKKLPLDDKITPITVTVHKIGDKLLVDPTYQEEEEITSKIIIGIKSDKNISSMQKGGEDGLTIEEIDKMVTIAQKNVEKLAKLLK